MDDEESCITSNEEKCPGGTRKTWKQCVNSDMKSCKLKDMNTLGEVKWRRAVRNSQMLPTPRNIKSKGSVVFPVSGEICVIGEGSRTSGSSFFSSAFNVL